MFRAVAFMLCFVFGSAAVIAEDKEDKRECVIMIPSVIKVAMGVGGSYSRGAMVCRTGKAFDGPWGADCSRGYRSLEETSLRPDDDASKVIYGRAVTARGIVTSDRTRVPASGRHLVDVLERAAPHHESKIAAGR